jgi:hypothetical protein
MIISVQRNDWLRRRNFVTVRNESVVPRRRINALLRKPRTMEDPMKSSISWVGQAAALVVVVLVAASVWDHSLNSSRYSEMNIFLAISLLTPFFRTFRTIPS